MAAFLEKAPFARHESHLGTRATPSICFQAYQTRILIRLGLAPPANPQPPAYQASLARLRRGLCSVTARFYLWAEDLVPTRRRLPPTPGPETLTCLADRHRGKRCRLQLLAPSAWGTHSAESSFQRHSSFAVPAKIVLRQTRNVTDKQPRPSQDRIPSRDQPPKSPP